MLNGQEAVAGALSLVELLQFARQITLGMASCLIDGFTLKI